MTVFEVETFVTGFLCGVFLTTLVVNVPALQRECERRWRNFCEQSMLPDTTTPYQLALYIHTLQVNRAKKVITHWRNLCRHHIIHNVRGVGTTPTTAQTNSPEMNQTNKQESDPDSDSDSVPSLPFPSSGDDADDEKESVKIYPVRNLPPPLPLRRFLDSDTPTVLKRRRPKCDIRLSRVHRNHSCDST